MFGNIGSTNGKAQVYQQSFVSKTKIGPDGKPVV